jgi:predicted TIM-barrel fold metal-dependent hydrolase
MNRRTFLEVTAGATLTELAANEMDAAEPIPVIDTHIHLFDTSRPQGVPWPAKDDAVLYHTALPERYRKLAVPFGVKGAIEVECSTWLEDNQWVLDVAAKDPIIVGTVGDLEPGKPEFRKHLDRFHKNPLFLGIRYGNLWDRDLGKSLQKPDFVADLKLLAQAGLVLDTANPTEQLMRDALGATELVPNLRVVVDHLPEMEPVAVWNELAKRPNVWVKISGIVRRVNGKVPLDVAFYKDRLDHIFGTFGEDRVMFGSDWPNSDQWATYPEVFKLAKQYFDSKSRAVAEKYYWKNSIAAYRWVHRDAGQPKL